MSHLTIADMFNGVGKVTPIACRWSTVIHGAASPEFLRDPRGFAIKFYTQEGNYDIVGLNFPVFFIRDGIRFPEMIRALKPNPVTGVQEWWRIWDLFSNFPESVHMFSWLMDDVGIPASYRELDGWGIHAFKWINANGHATLVRYYYKSSQGVLSLDDDEAVLKDFSFATTDLFENIRKGNYPKWTMYIQVMDKPLSELNFDPLDTTKQWPETMFPLIEVGEFVFDTNVGSQFRDNEMIAFAPSRYIPGISGSDDKMLQTRQFAYADTQRYRLGVNNQMLPVNRPKCDYTPRHQDGTMNFAEGADDYVNYFPSRLHPNLVQAPTYNHDTEHVSGQKIRQNITTMMTDFSQAGDRYRSFNEDRQDRFAKRIASSLSGSKITDDLYDTWLTWWEAADSGLATKIKTYRSILVQGDRNKNTTKLHDFRRSFLRASGSKS